MLVVDIELAEGNGVAVIRHARQLYPPEGQPLIVVLTNYASDFVRDHCFAAGADYFLDKMRDISLLKGDRGGWAESKWASEACRPIKSKAFLASSRGISTRKVVPSAGCRLNRKRPAQRLDPVSHTRQPMRPPKSAVIHLHPTPVIREQKQIALRHRQSAPSRTCCACAWRTTFISPS